MSDPQQIADRFRRLAADFDRRVAAVPADRWDDPTPCPDWSARELVGHLVEFGGTVCGWAGVDPPGGPTVQDDPVGAWRQTRDAIQAVLDDPALSGTEMDGMSGPTTVGATVDRFGGMDLLIHGWDLARATGQDETLPGDEVRRVHADALDLGPALRSDGVCGPLVAVAPDAPEQSRLLGLLGRTP